MKPTLPPSSRQAQRVPPGEAPTDCLPPNGARSIRRAQTMYMPTYMAAHMAMYIDVRADVRARGLGRKNHCNVYQNNDLREFWAFHRHAIRNLAFGACNLAFSGRNLASANRNLNVRFKRRKDLRQRCEVTRLFWHPLHARGCVRAHAQEEKSRR